MIIVGASFSSREHQAPRIYAAGSASRPEMRRLLHFLGQPEHCALDFAQQPHPHVEYFPVRICGCFERAENEADAGRPASARLGAFFAALWGRIIRR